MTIKIRAGGSTIKIKTSGSKSRSSRAKPTRSRSTTVAKKTSSGSKTACSYGRRQANGRCPPRPTASKPRPTASKPRVMSNGASSEINRLVKDMQKALDDEKKAQSTNTAKDVIKADKEVTSILTRIRRGLFNKKTAVIYAGVAALMVMEWYTGGVLFAAAQGAKSHLISKGIITQAQVSTVMAFGRSVPQQMRTMVSGATGKALGAVQAAGGKLAAAYTGLKSAVTTLFAKPDIWVTVPEKTTIVPSRPMSSLLSPGKWEPTGRHNVTHFWQDMPGQSLAPRHYGGYM